GDYTGAGEAWEGAATACPNRSIVAPPPLRTPTAGGCDSPALSEPYPVSVTDASGASLVRPDLPSIAKVRTIVKNKRGTYLLVVGTGRVPVIPMRMSAAPVARAAIHVTGLATAILEATGRHRPASAALISLHQARRSPSHFASSSSTYRSRET
ncbi:MAG: hypothetical protein ACJ8BH_08780, partial [Microvirga sp.]